MKTTRCAISGLVHPNKLPHFHHRCYGLGRSTRTQSTTRRFPCLLVDREMPHGTSKFCEARPPRGTFSNSQSSRRVVAIPPLLTGIARDASAKEHRALRPWRNFPVGAVHSPSVRRYYPITRLCELTLGAFPYIVRCSHPVRPGLTRRMIARRIVSRRRRPFLNIGYRSYDPRKGEFQIGRRIPGDQPLGLGSKIAAVVPEHKKRKLALLKSPSSVLSVACCMASWWPGDQ